jgi:hypothetical protein
MSVENPIASEVAEAAKPSLPPSRGRFLRRRAAAKYLTDLGLTTAFNTLQKLATTGGGPVFYKFGRWPLYREEDLDDYALARLSGPLASTSQPFLKPSSVRPSRVGQAAETHP